MRVVVWLGSVAGLAFSLLAPPVRAQNPAAAEALFEEARAAMAAGSFDIACARFRDSDKLDPAVGTRFNLADCEERRGRIATAWSAFRGVASELGPEDDRKPIAEDRARALAPRLPYVTLLRTPQTPPGVRVRIDGVELGEASIGVALPMDPGTHELVLLSPAQGGAEQRSSFELREGQHATVPVRIAVKPPAPVELEPRDDESAGGSVSARRVWALVAGGIGIAGVTTGAVTGLITLDKKNTADRNCDDEARVCNAAGVAANDSGRKFAMASSVGFGVGVAGLATAAYLWLTEPAAPPRGSHSSIRGSAARKAAPRVSSQVSWSSAGGFVALSGSF
jgi:hypothetical protein